jgi:hypothetical protein
MRSFNEISRRIYPDYMDACLGAGMGIASSAIGDISSKLSFFF